LLADSVMMAPGFVLAFLLTAAASTATAAPPPVEAFFRPPEIADAKLSPGGRWLALATSGGEARTAIVAIDLRGGEQPRQVVRLPDADVSDFDWVNDDRLVFRIYDSEAGSGDQRFAAGLFSVRANGEDLRVLVSPRTRFVTRQRIVAEPLRANHVLLHVPRNGGDEVVVGELQIRQGQQVADVVPKRLNVVTQRAVSLARGAPEQVMGWLFDAAGEPALATSVREGRSTIYRRDGGEWRQVAEFPALGAAFVPRFLDGEGRLFVTVAGREGYAELRRFDLEAGRVGAEPVVRTPGFDFTGSAVVDPADGRLLGLRIVTDAETTHWLDPRLKAAQARADARFPGRVNRLSCGRCAAADLIVLVRSYSDRDPGQWSLYRPAEDRWEAVAQLRRDIDPATMGTLDLHRIAARDGLSLPVWVTLPMPKPEAAAPAVVLVHGGPWVRGVTWGWRAEAQFLASRGWVVIEPEFRGSTGYGRRHFEAGWKQWGRAMQDDVADAVAWAIARGIADPKRVCIAGGSYGGYAALMGLIRDPQLYRCGVAWAAVTDPRLLFRWSFGADLSDEARQFGLPVLIGDPVADAARLAEVAPVEQAVRIQAPLLLAFGGRDARVPIEHGTRLREALRAAGREPEYVVYPEEGHGWQRLENRLDFYRRVERFLAAQLQ